MIDAHGYGPAFVVYGLLPLVAAAIVIFALGPLCPHPAFHDPGDPARSRG